MKKISLYFLIILLSVVVFLLGFDYKIGKQPNAYYQVYLDNELIGTIESRKELEDYINNQADTIRDNIKDYSLKIDAIRTFKKYSDLASNDKNLIVDKIKYLIDNKTDLNISDIDVENLNFYKDMALYTISDYEYQSMVEYIEKNSIYSHANEVFTPNGIKIKKIYTYDNNIVSIEEIYKNIILKKSCTVAGYKFTIKSKDENVEDMEIYTLDKAIFNDAIEELITIFVDENQYKLYKEGHQTDIVTTGTIIENIYVDENITYKAVNIPVEKKIYTSSNELSAYLLHGDDFKESIVQVRPGDSVESISFDNQISVQEFLIYNPKYTSRDNLLVVGTDVVISKIDPKLHIVVETYEVADKETSYSTIEKYDENLNQGSIIVTQDGVNGLERVYQNVKIVNGQISYIDPVDKEVLKASIPKIVNIGTRYVPTIGSVSSWGWPTDSGYTISSYYGYRPMVFGRSWHSGIDIAGTGYGSRIYAANNGVIITREWHYSYGYYIIIDHNNGYYTLYAHMSSFAPEYSVGSTVERGSVIGYVGSTGEAYGPHLHYEIRVCNSYNCTTNPLSYY